MKTQLAELGDYWSILAKCVHTIRNHMKRLRGYLEESGEGGLLKKAPQRPLKGRWGSATISEKDIGSIGKEQLVRLFSKLLEYMSKGKPSNNNDAEMDEGESYSEQVDRFSKLIQPHFKILSSHRPGGSQSRGRLTVTSCEDSGGTMPSRSSDVESRSVLIMSSSFLEDVLWVMSLNPWCLGVGTVVLVCLAPLPGTPLSSRSTCSDQL